MTARKTTAKKSAKGAGKKAAAKSPAKKPAAKKSARKAPTFAKGDHVAWETSQGETHGIVERKLTRPATIKTHKVAASPDNPEYLVRSDKSGAQAAHKPSSLKKRRAD